MTEPPPGLRVDEWEARGGRDVHFPPESAGDGELDPLMTLCGILGVETTPSAGGNATCAAWLALSGAQQQ